MEVKGMQHIAAPREAVWRVLNNTELLIGCIDGCERLERESPERINAAIKVNLGLFALRFHGALLLSNVRPPYSYTIAGEGRGAMSGLATGETEVWLEEVPAKSGEAGSGGGDGAELAQGGSSRKAGAKEAAGCGAGNGGHEGRGGDRFMETELHYHMRGAAEGKIAKLGSKLLSKTAAKIAARFFERVAEKAQRLTAN